MLPESTITTAQRRDPAERRRSTLRKWFMRSHRRFPWRQYSTPWHVLLAEMLLLRTRADIVAKHTRAHEEWEVFSRIKLAEGGALDKYYPLNDEGWAEYEEWRKHKP